MEKIFFHKIKLLENKCLINNNKNMMLGGVIGISYVVLKLILFVGLLILLWNVYVALRIYIKKNSDVKWKEKDRLVNVSLLLILSRRVLPGCF